MKRFTSFFIPIIALLLLTTSSVYSTTVTATPVTGDPAKPLTVKESVKAFYSLPRSERKSRIKEAKKMWKQYKADVKSGKAKEGDNHILAIIFAILIPPIGVLIYEGKITTKFWIALLLTLLFWLPGAIYALLVVTGNA